jgi:hypothetical protein
MMPTYASMQRGDCLGNLTAKIFMWIKNVLLYEHVFFFWYYCNNYAMAFALDRLTRLSNSELHQTWPLLVKHPVYAS